MPTNESSGLKIKTVIFDFDGTIADTFDLIIKIINENPARFGIDGIDESEIPRLRRLSTKYLLREFNIHLLQVPEFVTYIQQELSRRLAQVQPFPHMIDVLTNLKLLGLRLGVVTSNSAENVENFLKVHETGIFDFIVAEKSLFGKHILLEKVMSLNNLDKREVLYVGDEVRDIKAAKKAGVRIASVTWGFNSVDLLKKHDPDYLLNTPSEILDIKDLRAHTEFR